MGSDRSAFGAALPLGKPRLSLGDLGLLALLLLVFVGIAPFEVRDANALLHGADESGAGNLARQSSYLAVFAAAGIAAARAYGWRILRAVPIPFLLVLGWCIASAAWTAEPYVTLRRAALECIVVAAVFLSVETVGTSRSLQWLRWILAGVLIVNWLSIPLVPQAIHLTGETDPGLVGDWRGLYFHKNIAGAVCALSALVFFFSFLETRRWWDAVLFASAAAFAAMTQSKTSIILLPVALAAGLAYRLAWRRALDRQIALVAFAWLAFVAGAAAIFEWNAIANLLANPEQLTGRTEIWRAELAFIADHPWLGSGFGSFADTGAGSPLRHYIGSAWIANISHGHSGYLQLLVTIGGIGFVLAMAALIVWPALRFLKADDDRVALKSLLFAIFVFVVFHNVLESDWLEGDGAAWVSFLLAMAMLKNIRGDAI
jgi:O-antigen ligase